MYMFNALLSYAVSLAHALMLCDTQRLKTRLRCQEWQRSGKGNRATWLATVRAQGVPCERRGKPIRLDDWGVFHGFSYEEKRTSIGNGLIFFPDRCCPGWMWPWGQRDSRLWNLGIIATLLGNLKKTIPISQGEMSHSEKGTQVHIQWCFSCRTPMAISNRKILLYM